MTAAPCSWDAAIAYKSGSVVQGADGNQYRAARESQNVQPLEAITRADWELVGVLQSAALLVPGRFPTINAALDFACNARIDGDAILTVQVADGVYDYGVNTVLANHPDGARLRLRGNPAQPAHCKIIWQDSVSGIVVDAGHRLGGIEGFELIGQYDHSVPPFTVGAKPALTANPPSSAGGGTKPLHLSGDGIGAQGGATVSVRNCIVRKWLHGVTAWGGSHFDAFATTANNCWDSGFFGYNNSSIHLRDCVANDSSDGLGGLGFGIILEGASSGFLKSCSANGNHVAGFYANDGSCLVMRNCTAKRNGDGILLRAATIEGDGNTIADNRDSGVHFLAGSGGRMFGSNCSHNPRNFLSEENSVLEIGVGDNFSSDAAIAGFSCKSGGLITGTRNFAPAHMVNNVVDYEPYVPPASQYMP